MRLSKLLCLMLILLSTDLEAQDLQIHVDKKGRIGFADLNGNVVIKCQYESAQPFSEGTAIVMKGGKYGIIDARGKAVLPLKYTQISSWNKELYIIKDGKKMGLSNRQGKIVLPVKYSHVSKPNIYGRALIAAGGKPTVNEKKNYMFNAKYGIIDNHGDILVQPKYKGLYEFSWDPKGENPFHEGKRLEYSYHYLSDTLSTDCSFLGFSGNALNIFNAGIMDGNGKELLKPGKFYYVMQPQSDMVRYYIVKKKETLCGYYNIYTGKSFQAAQFKVNIKDMNYWSHGDFIGNLAPVNGEAWSFIDKTGKTLRSGYTSLKHSLCTGLWAAKNSSGKWEIFDDANSDVKPISGFDDINFPANKEDKEIFSVSKDGKYGCVSRSGDVVIPFEYDYAMGNSLDYVLVEKGKKWGALKADNTKLIPAEYVSIIIPTERNTNDFWVRKADSLYYHLNVVTRKVHPTGYKKVFTNFRNGISHVAPVDMKVSDSQVNRAQMYKPNTAKELLDKLDMANEYGAFGYLLGSDDKMLIDLPVSTLYRDIVVKEIEKRGSSLTEAEKKNILLEVTKENRAYDLKTTLGEEEWNY